MSLMDTAPGGEEQGSYEEKASAYPSEGQPSNKSSGQLGDPSDKTTTDPSQTEGNKENQQQGSAFNESGMSGQTTVEGGKADATAGGDPMGDRKAEGYGGDADMNKEIGA